MNSFHRTPNDIFRADLLPQLVPPTDQDGPLSYSFPNQIPLPPAAVRRVVAAVELYPFDRIYGAWWDKVIAAPVS